MDEDGTKETASSYNAERRKRKTAAVQKNAKAHKVETKCRKTLVAKVGWY